MKKIFLVLFMVLILNVGWIANAQEILRYNPHENCYEYADKDDVLRYNPHENKYQYNNKNSDMYRYNIHENIFEPSDDSSPQEGDHD